MGKHDAVPYTVIEVQGKPVLILIEHQHFSDDWLQSVHRPELNDVPVLLVRDTQELSIYDLPGLAQVCGRLSDEEWGCLQGWVKQARKEKQNA